MATAQLDAAAALLEPAAEEETYGDEDFEDYNEECTHGAAAGTARARPRQRSLTHARLPPPARPDDDDDFEDDDAPPPPVHAAPAPLPTFSKAPPLPPASLDPHQSLMAALAAENEQALRYSASRPEFVTLQAVAKLAPEVENRTVVSLADIKDNLGLTDAQAEAQSKRKPRFVFLMARITLAISGNDEMLDVAPKSKAELAATGRGQFSQMDVKGTQTNADASEIETQTETWDGSDASAQAPEDLGMSREALEAAATGKRPRKRASLMRKDSAQAGALQTNDELRLQNFMLRYGGVVDKLLDERDARRAAPKELATLPKADTLSAASMPLAYAPLLEGRRAAALAFGIGVNGELLLAVAYDRVSKGSARSPVDAMAIVAVWTVTLEGLNLGRVPAAPAHVLCAEGACRSLCWVTSHAVVAGLADGGLCVWDVRSSFAAVPEAAEDASPSAVPSLPTYTTEYDPELSCGGEVCAIALVPAADDASNSNSGAGAGGLAVGSLAAASASAKANTQFISLDTWGRASVWMLIELRAADVEGAEADFGLRVGGRVKLLQIADHLPLGSGAFASGEVAARSGRRIPERVYTPALATIPGETNEFVVAADGGRCFKGARYSRPTAPRKYYANDDPIESQSGRECTDAVASVDASPFLPGVFVAAHANGCLAVHHCSRAHALLSWRDFGATGLCCVRWSQSKPGVFLALDDEANVHIFDLLERTNGPSAVETFGGGERLPVRLELPSLSALAQMRGSPPSTTSLAARAFAVAYDDGVVASHAFSEDRFAASSAQQASEERAQMLEVLAKHGVALT